MAVRTPSGTPPSPPPSAHTVLSWPTSVVTGPGTVIVSSTLPPGLAFTTCQRSPDGVCSTTAVHRLPSVVTVAATAPLDRRTVTVPFGLAVALGDGVGRSTGGA